MISSWRMISIRWFPARSRELNSTDKLIIVIGPNRTRSELYSSSAEPLGVLVRQVCVLDVIMMDSTAQFKNQGERALGTGVSKAQHPQKHFMYRYFGVSILKSCWRVLIDVGTWVKNAAVSVTERIAAHETRGLLTLHQHQAWRRTAESSFIHLRNNKRQVRYSARTDSVNKKWSDADIKKDLCRMIAYHSTLIHTVNHHDTKHSPQVQQCRLGTWHEKLKEYPPRYVPRRSVALSNECLLTVSPVRRSFVCMLYAHSLM